MAGLAVKGSARIISGGYQGEGVGTSRAFQNWSEVDYNGSAVSSYFYHDSDYAMDSQSTKVTVTIEDRWNAVRQNDNSFIITVESYLTRIERHERWGYAGSTPRVIQGRQDVSGVGWLFGPFVSPVNSEYVVFSGHLLIGTRTHQIWPEGTPGRISESSVASIYYRSYTQGFNVPPPSPYVDEFDFGLMYKNTLPRKLHPPVIQKVEQTPNICEYAVTADFTVTMDDIPDDNEHTVHLQVGADPNFSDARDFYATARKSADGMTYFYFSVCCLKPDTRYYYRAILNQPDLYETDWRNGDFTTIKVIKPSEVVPEFSESECILLTTNQYVPEWPNW